MGMNPDLTDKRCLIAGSGPVADAIVQRLGRDTDAIGRIDDSGDLQSMQQARAIVEAHKHELGAIDVAVGAFHHRADQPFTDIGDDDWHRSLERNLKAAFVFSREVARTMIASDTEGVIVLVPSDVASRPGPATGAYAATQAGIQLLVTAMALDLAPDGIRVCGVAAAEHGADPPGGEVITAADIAALVAFSASEAASYVVGSTFLPNGPLPVRS